MPVHIRIILTIFLVLMCIFSKLTLTDKKGV